MIHELKSWPNFFEEIAAGRKVHELRINDRNYKVGDILCLKEYDDKSKVYSGKKINVEVTYITSEDNPCVFMKDALKPGYCILSIRKID